MAALGAAVLSVLARAQTNTNVPKWTPTYNMSESTVCADPLLPPTPTHPTPACCTERVPARWRQAAADLPPGRVMPCNYTGLYDYDAYPELAKFGLVDYDCALLSPLES